MSINGGRVARTEEVPLARSIMELTNPDPQNPHGWGVPAMTLGGVHSWYRQMETWVQSACQQWRAADREEWLLQAWVFDRAWTMRQSHNASTTLAEAMDVDSLQQAMESAGWEYSLPPMFKQVPRLLR